MTKAAFAVLGSALLLAGITHAQPAPMPTAPGAPAPAAEVKPPARGNTVSGLTVEGKTDKSMKPCSSRDKACIAMVVAELKQLYPERLKTFCFQRDMRAMRNSALFSDVDQSSSSNPPQLGATYGIGEPLKAACAPAGK